MRESAAFLFLSLSIFFCSFAPVRYTFNYSQNFHELVVIDIMRDALNRILKFRDKIGESLSMSAICIIYTRQVIIDSFAKHGATKE